MIRTLTPNLKYSIFFLAILVLTFLIALIVDKLFRQLIKKSSEDLNNDPTNYKFLRRVVTAMIYLVGFGAAIYIMPNLRALANSMLAGAGIMAVALGFASQHALSNIISGFFIVIFKPFRVNDRLKIRDLNGVVEDITLRHTVIRDFENRRILIPNAVISDEIIINADFADDKICKWIEIGISYDSDIDLAKRIMESEVLDHPMHVDPRTEEQIAEGIPEVPVRVLSLGEYSVNLRAWAWSKDAVDGFVMSCDLYESIKKRFDAEGIEIPFPYRNIIHKNSS
ncbi:MAG: mechanosensitive ion channel family protein [Saprospiraceae bacterium]|nr:mechanosensitive ion channel family protein [Saprospiraceae bacterium]